MTNNYEEEEFKGFVQQLEISGRIDDQKEAGITKFMLANGYDALSQKQKYVFDNMISNNTVKECKMCANEIPWCEMFEALDNGGYCSHCQNALEKAGRE